MTQRPGKAHETEHPADEIDTQRTHLKKHVHLTNCIHLKNHLHLQSHGLMLDARRPLQLPLMREVTALQKFRTLQDPTTSSSFSPSSSGGRVNTPVADSHKDARAAGVELLSKSGRKSNASSRGDPRVRIEKLQKSGGKENVRELKEDYYGNSDVKMITETNGKKFVDPDSWDGETDSGVPRVDVRGRVRRTDSVEYEGLTPRQFSVAGDPSVNSLSSLKSEKIKEFKERGRKEARRGKISRPEERWQGDPARREELARRVIMENNGGTPSPLSKLLAKPRGSARKTQTLLGREEHQSEGESLFRIEDGELSAMEREMTKARPSRHSSLQALDGHAESPLILRDSLRRREQKRPQSSGKRSNGSRTREGINLRRPRNRKSTKPAVNGETPALIVDDDELEVSELPPNGCGMPWDWSRGLKHKGKSRIDLTGLTCAFPETIKRNEQSNRHGSFSESRREVQVAVIVPPDQSISSLDSDENVLPLLIGDDAHDSDLAGFILEPGVSASAREIPSKYGASKGSRKCSLQDAVKGIPVNAPSLSRSKDEGGEAHRSLSQKYRPKNFRELIGLSVVVKSLSTAIVKSKVAPVYLFMGPRGTGKTATARIFASALNCLSLEPERRPCGICRECGTTNLNRNPDVKEIDAASNADLASMKAMLGNFVPCHARYKVFIVEGCDLLGTEIWNAFLKVLEEPPRNVVFILITTDPERLPLTATSRCQKFHFCKVKESDMVSRLQSLSSKEKLQVDLGALQLIASRADGSLRDAEITLDQLSLLDRDISLALVQELVGLLPDSKLLDLLDLALSADAVNTIRTMRELLDSGVEPLSLVSQLGSLITDILAGSFDVQRETRKKGFFRRNFSSKEEQQRLRQALRILSEAEKQLRVSNDRATWLTNALLQFAPDRSFLPSSVNTSVAQSPVAPQNTDATPEETGMLRGLPIMEEEIHSSKKSQTSQAPEPAFGRTLITYLENRRRSLPAAKVHPSESPADNATTQAERKLEEAWAKETQQAEPDEHHEDDLEERRPLHTGELHVFSRQNMDVVWSRVIRACRSKNLRNHLQMYGRLISVGVADDVDYACVQVEFQLAQHKQKAERSRSSICNAFQLELGSPVDLRITLTENVESNFDDTNLSHSRNFMDDAQVGPSITYKEERLPEEIYVEALNMLTHDLQGAPLHSRRRSRPRKHRQTEITEQDADIRHGSEVGNVPRTSSSRSHRSRRRSSARKVEGQNGRFEDPRASTTQEQYPGRVGKVPPPKTQKVLLKTMMEEPQSEPEYMEESHFARGRAVKPKNAQFRSGSSLASSRGAASSIEHQNMKMESRLKRSTDSVLCWNAPLPEKRKAKRKLQGRRRAQGKALFLRLVPCAKSNPTKTSNLTNTVPPAHGPKNDRVLSELCVP